MCRTRSTEKFHHCFQEISLLGVILNGNLANILSADLGACLEELVNRAESRNFVKALTDLRYCGGHRVKAERTDTTLSFQRLRCREGICVQELEGTSHAKRKCLLTRDSFESRNQVVILKSFGNTDDITTLRSGTRCSRNKTRIRKRFTTAHLLQHLLLGLSLLGQSFCVYIKWILLRLGNRSYILHRHSRIRE